MAFDHRRRWNSSLLVLLGEISTRLAIRTSRRLKLDVRENIYSHPYHIENIGRHVYLSSQAIK
jgi:hypothetical protein